MANHKSAKKRAVQTEKRRVRNKGYMSGVKTAIKKFQTGLEQVKAGKLDKAEAHKLLQGAQSALSKAVVKGLLHRNNAARRTGRLARSLANATK